MIPLQLLLTDILNVTKQSLVTTKSSYIAELLLCYFEGHNIFETVPKKDCI